MLELALGAAGLAFIADDDGVRPSPERKHWIRETVNGNALVQND